MKHSVLDRKTAGIRYNPYDNQDALIHELSAGTRRALVRPRIDRSEMRRHGNDVDWDAGESKEIDLC
jgi:hypothetical protein